MEKNVNVHAKIVIFRSISFFNKPEIITKYGYIVEIHHATTEDGYILELHRIVGGPKSPPSKGKKVYFLMHGLIFSSAAFVLSGPNRALGIVDSILSCFYPIIA